MALVHHLTRKYTKHPSDYEEIRGHCFIGLTKALNAFDKNKHTRFYSYAYRVIENEVIAFIRNKNSGKEQIFRTAVREETEYEEGRVSLFNLIPDHRKPFSIENKECITKVLSAAKEKDRIIFSLYLRGFDFSHG